MPEILQVLTNTELRSAYSSYDQMPRIIYSNSINKGAFKLDGQDIQPTHQYDMAIHTLYGLNEKIAPNSAKAADFKLMWDEFTARADDPTFGVYAYFPERGHLVRYMEPYWHEIAIQVSNSRLYNNPEGSLTWEEVRAIHKNIVVAVAGCSVGKRVAENIVANLSPAHIKLADPKDAHVANAPRAGWTYEDIGHNKAIAAANQLYYHTGPYFQISVYPEGIHDENISDFINGNNEKNEPKASLVIEETDDLNYKIWIREQARKAGVPVLMVSDLGSVIQCDIRRFDIDSTLSLAVGISDEELYSIRDEALANPGNLELFYKFVFAMLGKSSTRGEFKSIVYKEIDLDFGGVPQLPSTVSASGGIAAEIVARMFLGWKQNERTIIDLASMTIEKEGKEY